MHENLDESTDSPAFSKSTRHARSRTAHSEHVFGPLDMVDSSFNVAEGKRDRLSQNHYIDEETGELWSKVAEGSGMK